MVMTERRTGGARWTSTLFILFAVALAALLGYTDSVASASSNAALPTFSTPCFMPDAIYNGLPPQQTSSYTVPATGVTTVRAVLRGQNGGRGGYDYLDKTASTAGGLGATLVVEVPVTPGQVLHVGRLTGAPGGRGSAPAPHPSHYSGGKGGDAQYLSTAGSDGCAHALAVAGGGGGGSGSRANGGNADAGAGATAGQNGGDNYQADGGGGGGAKADIGGTPGKKGSITRWIWSTCNDGNNGRWGEFLTGGNGGDAPLPPSESVPGCGLMEEPGGGGGGAGYHYGGGGGSPYGYANLTDRTHDAGAGGGGSSFIDASAKKISLTAGGTAGDPLVVPVYDTAITVTSSPNPSYDGAPVTFTASVTVVGSGRPVLGGTVGIYLSSKLNSVPVGLDGKATLTTADLGTGTGYVQARFFDTTTPTEAYRDSVTPSNYTQVFYPCAPAPSFVAQPVNLTKTVGAYVGFGANVTLPSPYPGSKFTVQWQTSTNGGTTWTNVPGDVWIDTDGVPAGTAQVSITFNAFGESLPLGDLKYRALATTCGGTATSNTATLTVKGIAFDLSTLPAKTYGDAAFDISSYASASNVPVSFSSASTPVCTVAGNMVTLRAAGTCIIDADHAVTSGDPTALGVRQSFTVNKKTLTVVAGSPPSQPYGTATAPTVTCTAGFVGSDGFVTQPTSRVYHRIITEYGDVIYRPTIISATSVAKDYVTRCAGGDPGSNYTIGGYKDGKFTITAPLTTYALSVSKAGTGSGTVTSDPAGIDCESDCSQSYNSGTSVTLTAIASAGSTFAAWSGGNGTTNPNGTYTVSMSAAKSVTATFQANTSISAVSGSGTYGDNATLTATLKSGTTALSNKTVSFKLNGTAVGTGTTDSDGIATLSGVSLSGYDAGSYNDYVDASFAGDSGYEESSGQGNLTVGRANQTITFAQPTSPRTYGDSFDVEPTANSGLAVAVSASGGCTATAKAVPASGYTVEITSGTSACVLTASEDGDDNYNAASDVERTVNVQKASQTLSFTAGTVPTSKVYNGTFTPEATSNSGLAVTITVSGVCSISDGVVTMTSGTGTCAVEANRAGNDNYDAADQITANVAATKASQTISFGALANKTYGDASFTLSATGGDSGNAVMLALGTGSVGCSLSDTNSDTVTITGATGVGQKCIIVASQAGNNNYATAADVTRDFTITKASLTVNADNQNMTYGDSVPSLSYQITGFVNSETLATSGVTGSSSLSTTATPSSGAGTYPITVAVGNLASSNYGFTLQNGTLTVAKRQAKVENTGDNYIAIPSAGNATVNLKAKVSRISGNLGALSLARVEFTVKRYNGAVHTTVYAMADANGNAATTALVPTSDDPYTVEVRIDSLNRFWTSGAGVTDIGSLQVIVGSGTGRTAGGGWIPDAANAINGKSNFGFTVQNSKTGIRGNSLFIYRLKEGSSEVQYIVKSNSWQGGGLTFNVNTDSAKATFTGKATVQRYVNGVLDTTFSGGNHTFTVDVFDGDLKTPKVRDTYAITVRNSSNVIVKQLGSRAAPVTLGGGNVLVQKG